MTTREDLLEEISKLPEGARVHFMFGDEELELDETRTVPRLEFRFAVDGRKLVSQETIKSLRRAASLVESELGDY